ncbi:unnamed protein product [Calypogeia fissa]
MPPAVADGGVQVAMMRPDNVHHTVSRLLKDPRDRLPERYMWPDYETIDLWTPAKDESATVPLINLSGLESGDPVVVERLANEVGRACEEWGFFQVVNHGVAEEVSDAHRRVGMDFLDMPVELKERATDPCGRYFGYGGRYEKLSSRVPWMEYLAGNHTPAPEADTLRKKIWPDGEAAGQTFLSSVTNYSVAMQKLSLQLLDLLARHLGLAGEVFTKPFEDQTTFESSWRFNRYPPCPPQAVTFGVGPHSDPSVLVLLQQDEVGGLQVRKNGTWFSVNPTPGAIIVNVGDCLEAWSNGRFQSAVHQVLLTEKKVWRLSMIYALNPNKYINISSPDELVDAQHPRRYRPFTWPDFIANLRANRHRIRDKLALDFVKIPGAQPQPIIGDQASS